LRLPESELTDALSTHAYAAKIKSDFVGGVRSGVNGTPFFFINGRALEEGYALGNLVLAIERELHAVASF
jgi:protein-disulfide isomerase